MTWVEQAACAGLSPTFDLDFIMPNHILVCADCPVIVPCLDEALTRNRHDDFGIWGGTDKAQRAMIRRGRVNVQDVWLSNLEALHVHDDGCDCDSCAADLAG